MRVKIMFLALMLSIGAIAAGLSQQTVAGPQFVVALQGYDAVSYFEGEPKRGEFLHSVHWNGAAWLFATPENKERFRKNPTAYAPQFDGYCAFAASRGYKAPGDALTWKVVNGKLYVNFNADAARYWSEDIPGNIRKAEENWPKINAL
jgi:YHS domain-containing protein